MEEVWKSVGIVKGVDFTGLYEASNLGYIRSVDSICEYIDGRKRHLKGRVLRPSIDKKGYSSVTLYKNGLKVCIRVHRLVLQTFEPNPNPEIYTEINHNELTQNELLNLIKKGIDRSGENLNKHKTGVAILDLQGNFIKQFDSIASARSFLNCHPNAVSSCLKGRSKTVKGCKCVYLENYQNKY